MHRTLISGEWCRAVSCRVIEDIVVMNQGPTYMVPKCQVRYLHSKSNGVVEVDWQDLATKPDNLSSVPGST